MFYAVVESKNKLLFVHTLAVRNPHKKIAVLVPTK